MPVVKLRLQYIGFAHASIESQAPPSFVMSAVHVPGPVVALSLQYAPEPQKWSSSWHGPPIGDSVAVPMHVPWQHATSGSQVELVATHSPPFAHCRSITHAPPAGTVPVNTSSHGSSVLKPGNLQFVSPIASAHLAAAPESYLIVPSSTPAWIEPYSPGSTETAASQVARSTTLSHATARSHCAPSTSSGRSSTPIPPPPPQPTTKTSRATCFSIRGTYVG